MLYFGTLFDQLDIFLNSIFGGEADQSISERAAIAAEGGNLPACWLCAWLHKTLRQNHCKRTLDNEPMSSWAKISAGVQLSILFGVIFYGPLFLLGVVR